MNIKDYEAIRDQLVIQKNKLESDRVALNEALNDIKTQINAAEAAIRVSKPIEGTSEMRSYLDRKTHPAAESNTTRLNPPTRTEGNKNPGHIPAVDDFKAFVQRNQQEVADLVKKTMSEMDEELGVVSLDELDEPKSSTI